ncbi:hypothetical protein C1D09_006585 [Mesorhizobium intechi]|uniref:Uncharacterized protein n=1 Tax=Mesorhizobium intechi TaxID=537601 RepID=A0A8T9AU22_9HYPH|nr:hypothetical protein [Mesorhizobium intechi]TSE12929.1 hypothetical protein C1D09_006585 [Mesorhizobium intechi]
MEKELPFEIAVIDDQSYENLVAEVRFPSKEFGLILSQEESRERIDVSIFSFISDGREKFYETKRIPEVCIDLKLFLSAIDEAVRRLKLLDIPR